MNRFEWLKTFCMVGECRFGNGDRVSPVHGSDQGRVGTIVHQHGDTYDLEFEHLKELQVYAGFELKLIDPAV